jgi:hypothetical protein
MYAFLISRMRVTCPANLIFPVQHFVISFFFYNEELFAPRPTLKLHDHPFSAVRDCLFSTFGAALHIRMAISSIHRYRTLSC